MLVMLLKKTWNIPFMVGCISSSWLTVRWIQWAESPTHWAVLWACAPWTAWAVLALWVYLWLVVQCAHLETCKSQLEWWNSQYIYGKRIQIFKKKTSIGWRIVHEQWGFQDPKIVEPWKIVDYNNLHICIPGWWFEPLWKKWVNVSWDYKIPNIWKHRTCSKPPTS